MSGSVDVGTLSGRVELEDHFTATAELVIHRIEEMDEKFGGFGHHIAEQATAFFTAEAALEALKEAAHLAAETLKEITIEGSHAADIEDTFKHLTDNAHLFGEELLGTMRDATHGTITDMDLMTRVNQNLAAGLKLTAEQSKIMADGAFALAKATGGDVAEAMDKMSTAMVTGRVRGVQLLTGKIDLKEAEEKYAASLGSTAAHLTEEGKIEATRIAILDKVATATERVGEQHVRLADKIKQSQVNWANFEEELGTSIAESPVIASAFDGVRDALNRAFGGTQKDAIHAITKAVNEGAIEVIHFAGTAADAAGIVGRTWYTIDNIYEHVVSGIQAITYEVERGLLAAAKAQAFLDPVGNATGAYDEEIKALTADTDRLYNSMAQGEKTVEANNKASDEWSVTTGHVKDAIGEIEARMKAAQKTYEEHAASTEKVAETHEKAATEVKKHDDALVQLGPHTFAQTKAHQQFAESVDAAGNKMFTFHDATKKVDGAIVEVADHVYKAAESHDKLGASADKAAGMLKKTTEEIKQEAKALEIARGYVDQYNELLAKQTGTAGQQEAAAIETWFNKEKEKLKDAGDNFGIEMEKLEQLHQKKLEMMGVNWDDLNKHSKASLIEIRDNAQKTYETVSSDVTGKYTREFIEQKRQERDAARDAVYNWGNATVSKIGEMKTAAQSFDDIIMKIEADQHRMSETFTTDIGKLSKSQIASYGGKTGIQALIDKMEDANAADPQGTRYRGTQEGAAQYTKDQILLQQLKNALATLGSDSSSGGSTTTTSRTGPSSTTVTDPYAHEVGSTSASTGSMAASRIPLGMTGRAPVHIVNHWYVNGTGAQVAQEAGNQFMKDLQNISQVWGS
jgi:hypothetical protein